VSGFCVCGGGKPHRTMMLKRSKRHREAERGRARWGASRRERPWKSRSMPSRSMLPTQSRQAPSTRVQNAGRRMRSAAQPKTNRVLQHNQAQIRRLPNARCEISGLRSCWSGPSNSRELKGDRPLCHVSPELRARNGGRPPHQRHAPIGRLADAPCGATGQIPAAEAGRNWRAHGHVA